MCNVCEKSVNSDFLSGRLKQSAICSKPLIQAKNKIQNVNLSRHPKTSGSKGNQEIMESNTKDGRTAEQQNSGENESGDSGEERKPTFKVKQGTAQNSH